MASIFQNSTLNITATAGLDSRASLYRDTATKVEVTNIRTTASLSVFVRREIFHTDTSTDIEDVPLFSRGWIGTSKTNSFPAGASLRTCGAVLEMPAEILVPVRRLRAGRYRINQASVTSDVHHAWRDLIEEYSQLSLTVSSDKLHAVAGLKTDMAARRDPDAKYAFGIWADSLKMDLVWTAFVDPGTKARRSYRTANWRAPSWSWASVDAEIMWPQSKGGWYRNGCSHSEQMCFNTRLLATEPETLDSLDSEAKARHPTLELEGETFSALISAELAAVSWTRTETRPFTVVASGYKETTATRGLTLTCNLTTTVTLSRQLRTEGLVVKSIFMLSVCVWGLSGDKWYHRKT